MQTRRGLCLLDAGLFVWASLHTLEEGVEVVLLVVLRFVPQLLEAVEHLAERSAGLLHALVAFMKKKKVMMRW